MQSSEAGAPPRPSSQARTMLWMPMSSGDLTRALNGCNPLRPNKEYGLYGYGQDSAGRFIVVSNVPYADISSEYIWLMHKTYMNINDVLYKSLRDKCSGTYEEEVYEWFEMYEENPELWQSYRAHISHTCYWTNGYKDPNIDSSDGTGMNGNSMEQNQKYGSEVRDQSVVQIQMASPVRSRVQNLLEYSSHLIGTITTSTNSTLPNTTGTILQNDQETSGKIHNNICSNKFIGWYGIWETNSANSNSHYELEKGGIFRIIPCI